MSRIDLKLSNLSLQLKHSEAQLLYQGCSQCEVVSELNLDKQEVFRTKEPGVDQTQKDQAETLGSKLAQETYQNTQAIQVTQTKINNQKLQPKDFQILAVVGKGAFGKVFQVQRKYPASSLVSPAKKKEVLAMKVINKEKLFTSNQTEFIKQEQYLMTQIEHPFIVALKHSFQTQHKLYLVMEFINGGHLFYLLNQEKLFRADLAKFYIAEIVLGLKYLHENKIVHRDLKPENVLLDQTGHIKITDFGMAKDMTNITDERTYSYVGTMYYMAPEVILDKRRAKNKQTQQGHAKEVDWWSLGVMVYEMFYGQLPFDASQPQKVAEKITTQQVKYPSKGVYKPPNDAIKFIKALLVKDPSKRLGYGIQGSNDVMTHPFFKGIDWTQLLEKKIKPPFDPNLSGPLDIQRVDKEVLQMKAQDTPTPTPVMVGSALAQMEDIFKDFSWRRTSSSSIYYEYEKQSNGIDFDKQLLFDNFNMDFNFQLIANSVPNNFFQLQINSQKAKRRSIDQLDVLNLNGVDLQGRISTLVQDQYKQMMQEQFHPFEEHGMTQVQNCIQSKTRQSQEFRLSLGPVFEFD